MQASCPGERTGLEHSFGNLYLCAVKTGDLFQIKVYCQTRMRPRVQLPGVQEEQLRMSTGKPGLHTGKKGSQQEKNFKKIQV